MLQIFVNDVPHSVAAPPHTWGDLLATLDEEVSGQGLLLTSARINGVEEPSFRDPVVTARRLGADDRVEVETATPAAFLRQCLFEAIRPLDQAADMAARLGATYRQADVTDAHDGLRTLADELRGLTALVGMLTGPLQLDLDAAVANGATVAEQMQEFGAALDSLVAAQEQQDWVSVADALEYDIEPSIRRFIELLTVVANRL